MNPYGPARDTPSRSCRCVSISSWRVPFLKWFGNLLLRAMSSCSTSARSFGPPPSGFERGLRARARGGVGETSPTLPGPRDARRRPASPASERRSPRKGPRGAGARRRTPRFRAPGGSPPPWVVRTHAVHRSSTRRTRRREPRAAARGSSSTEALAPAPSVVARWARRCREGNAGPAGGRSREPRVSCARRSAHSARRRSRRSIFHTAPRAVGLLRVAFVGDMRRGGAGSGSQ